MVKIKISERVGLVPLERAKKLLSYSPENGEVRWVARPSPRCSTAMIGTIAGSLNPSNGHRIIIIDGHEYYAQQVAWFLYYGEWPKGRLRFRDGNVLNHAINNMSDKSENDFDTKEGRRNYDREYDLSRTFGITSAEYDNVLKLQGGVCAVCRRPEKEMRNGRVKFLAVDHNHTTGAMRGIICAACNKGIGWFEENLDYLEAAIAYLKSHQPKQPAKYPIGQFGIFLGQGVM